MRALIHTTFGEASDVLEIAERLIPEPSAGEVRVRTVLSPIHNHDLWTIRGTYGFKPDLPALAGTEALGVVDSVGEGVDQLQIGQRVATGGTFGVWSEYFVAKASGLVPVPDSVSDETAAQMISMPFSALSLLEYLDVQPGEWIVQNTANGAVGKLVVQFAAARGVNVLGLVRRDAGVDELGALGIRNIVSTEARTGANVSQRSWATRPRARRSTRSGDRRPAICCHCSARAARSCRSERWGRTSSSYPRATSSSSRRPSRASGAAR